MSMRERERERERERALGCVPADVVMAIKRLCISAVTDLGASNACITSTYITPSPYPKPFDII